MKYTTAAFAFCACLLTASHGFSIDSTTHPEGVFHGHVDEHGNVTTTQIGPLRTNVSSSQSSQLRIRGTNNVLEPRGDPLDCVEPSLDWSFDVLHASLSLDHECDNRTGSWIGGQGFAYALSGTSVVYICNYDHFAHGCSSYDLNNGLKAVSTGCNGAAGSFHFGGKGKGTVWGACRENWNFCSKIPRDKAAN